MCFKNSAKITTLCCRECLINVQCTSGNASDEKKQIAKCHFPLKNADLNKQWIRFANRRIG